MQTLSNELSDLAQQEGISLSADQIFDRWNAIHDHDTTQTVHKQLKPAVKLVTEGKVYMTHMNNGQLMCHQ